MKEGGWKCVKKERQRKGANEKIDGWMDGMRTWHGR